MLKIIDKTSIETKGFIKSNEVVVKTNTTGLKVSTPILESPSDIKAIETADYDYHFYGSDGTKEGNEYKYQEIDIEEISKEELMKVVNAFETDEQIEIKVSEKDTIENVVGILDKLEKAVVKIQGANTKG